MAKKKIVSEIDDRAMATPSKGLAFSELPRTVGEIATTQIIRSALEKMPQGDGHGVLVIPGFLSDDSFNGPLRKHLDRMGYQSTGWSLGVNLGPTVSPIETAATVAKQFAEQTGGKISIVGHSLGGIYAREVAKLCPDLVRQVITLGSPFSRGKEPKNFAGKIFRWLNPDVESLDESDEYSVAPPLPTSAVYTRTDGIVGWGLAVQKDGHGQCENIEVRGSHCGLTHNASVWYVLADRLAQSTDQWKPFNRDGWRSLLYPTPFAG